MFFSHSHRSRTSRRQAKPFTRPARWYAARLRLEELDERVVPAFLDPVNYAVGTYPNAVVTSDFNNDTVQDLAFANWGDRTVSVLLGNADGTFDPAISSAAGNPPTSLAVGDFNDDGNLDLVTGDPGYGTTTDVTVLLGNGNGAFQTPAVIDLISYGGVESVAAGDFNADGLLDIGATSNYAWSNDYGGVIYGTVAVLLGTGTGTFGSPNWSNLIDGYNTFARFADFNADGKLDIASVSDRGYVFVGLGTGAGTFNYLNYYYNNGTTQVLATDVNNDDNVDLVTANWAGSVSVLLGTGTGSFGSPENYAAGSYASSVAAGDFNDDGFIDLISTNADTATVSVLLGMGTGAFKPPVSAAVGSTPWGVVVGDFDSDGLMDAASANNSSHDVSILINDGVWPALNSPSISINDVTVTEGNTGTVNATFIVSLSVASSQTVTVQFATADGSATTAEGDYQAVNGTLTFAPGQTTKTVAVPVNGDRVAEYTESFLLLLTDASNAFLADARGSGTITDNEPRASIDYGPVYVTEGNTGTRSAVFTLRLSNAYDQPVSVNYNTSNGSATAGSDYQAVSGTVTFAPGETVKTIPVTIYGDRLSEYDESFYVNLTGVSGYAYGVIQDDEPRVSIDSGPIYVTEGNTGTTTAVFTVRLNNAYDQPVDVNFSTAEGDTEWWGGDSYYGYYPPPPTATSGTDFQATGGTLTFAPGQTVKTIIVQVNGDRVADDSEEYFSVDLTGSPNGGIDEWTDHAVGIIVDDEPRVSISSASVTEGNAGTTAMSFAVTLSAAYDIPVTVDYATSDYLYPSYSATAGIDYLAASGSLTFAPGQTSKTFTVIVIGDRLGESDEYFNASFTGAVGASITTGTADGIIRENEPRISVSSASITEGNRGTKVMTFTVSLSVAYDQTVTVRYSTQDGSATAGEDYVATSGTLYFAPGQTTKTFTVVIKGDNKNEYNEVFYVLLSDASSNTSISNAYGYGTIIDDDNKGPRR